MKIRFNKPLQLEQAFSLLGGGLYAIEKHDGNCLVVSTDDVLSVASRLKVIESPSFIMQVEHESTRELYNSDGTHLSSLPKRNLNGCGLDAVILVVSANASESLGMI